MLLTISTDTIFGEKMDKTYFIKYEFINNISSKTELAYR